MSEDLLAYFVLKHCNLSKDDRWQIVPNNASVYNLNGIEQAMRVSFYDIHECEKVDSKAWPTANYIDDDETVPDYDEAHDDEEMPEDAYSGDEVDDAEIPDETYGDDDNGVSYAGASNDDEVFNAYKLTDQLTSKVAHTATPASVSRRFTKAGDSTSSKMEHQIIDSA